MAGTSVGLAPGGSGSGSLGIDGLGRLGRPGRLGRLAGLRLLVRVVRRRARLGRRLRSGHLRGRLRVADEDLASGGQASVVGGEDHVHAGDEAADAVPVGVVLHHGLLEEHGVAPVPELDAGVREGFDRLPVDDEALDPGAPEAAVSAFLGR